MEFSKNSELVTNICTVQIKSVNTVVDLSDLTTLYHTPSSIRLSNSGSLTVDGPLHKRTLSLKFPGLSTTDFSKFATLLKGQYQILVKLTNGDIYEIASNYYPMSLTTAFGFTAHQLSFSGSHPFGIKYRGNQPEDGITIDGFNYDFNFYLN